MLCNGLVLSSLQRFNGSPDVLFAGCSSVNLLGQSNDAFPSLGSAQRVSLLSLSLSLLCLALPASWSLGVVRPTLCVKLSFWGVLSSCFTVPYPGQGPQVIITPETF